MSREKIQREIQDGRGELVPVKESGYEGWQVDFLEAYREMRTIDRACKKLGISRYIFDAERDNNPVFRRYWRDAFDAVTDQIEEKTIDLVLNGSREPVFYNGEHVGDRTKEYPDLAKFMLTARRPEQYSEKIHVARILAAGDSQRSAAATIVEMAREMRESMTPAPPQIEEVKDADVEVE